MDIGTFKFYNSELEHSLKCSEWIGTFEFIV